MALDDDLSTLLDCMVATPCDRASMNQADVGHESILETDSHSPWKVPLLIPHIGVIAIHGAQPLLWNCEFPESKP